MNTSYSFTAFDANYPSTQVRDWNNGVHVPYLGEAEVKVTCDFQGIITHIDFIKRPYINSEKSFYYSSLSPLPTVDNPKMHQHCHRISIAWIKAQVTRDVLGKNLFILNQAALNQRKTIINRLGIEQLPPEPPQNTLFKGPQELFYQHAEHVAYEKEFEKVSHGLFEKLLPQEQMGFFFPLQDPSHLKQLLNNKEELCKQTAKAVALLFVNRCKVKSNIFVGDKKHNTFAGDLTYILDKFVKKRKCQTFPLTVSFIPHLKISAKKAKAFESIRDYLNTNQLIIETEDMLLDIYFASNYDQSDHADQPLLNPAFINAKKMFIHTYE